LLSVTLNKAAAMVALAQDSGSSAAGGVTEVMLGAMLETVAETVELGVAPSAKSNPDAAKTATTKRTISFSPIFSPRILFSFIFFYFLLFSFSFIFPYLPYSHSYFHFLLFLFSDFYPVLYRN